MSIYDEYTHLKCKCGGIIGMYDRENFTCKKCGKVLKSIYGKCDWLAINEKTGWQFPMIKKS